MARPDFICIGAQKAGTTWLYSMLSQNPSVFLPPIKEIHFFDYIVHVAGAPPPGSGRCFGKRAKALSRKPEFRDYFRGAAAADRDDATPGTPRSSTIPRRRAGSPARSPRPTRCCRPPASRRAHAINPGAEDPLHHPRPGRPGAVAAAHGGRDGASWAESAPTALEPARR